MALGLAALRVLLGGFFALTGAAKLSGLISAPASEQMNQEPSLLYSIFHGLWTRTGPADVPRQLLLQRSDDFRLFWIPWPCVTIAATTATPPPPDLLSISEASLIFGSFPYLHLPSGAIFTLASLKESPNTYIPAVICLGLLLLLDICQL
ncbi:transmembrane protein 35B isoform X1 [Herpailurus yagouaroundi]|uniref:transmembrane protein 35B isoform X1 n=1 Tax=Herpailurus yagouaroundi TaxID=1608482 RepID=UPI001AD6DA6F|nr:transmembrane protein 35B isoform X1 [Puma yagouaroundi]